MNSDGWTRIAARGDLAEGEVLGVETAGRDIAVYDIDGQLFATDNICSHAYARLSDGWLDNGEIECPLHAGRFDIKTGKATCPPAIDHLKTYPVRVVDETIEVKLD
jgi:naphthalene 1,2-dioxygenase system ferredoxin subunit